jgi:hypothetical protein
LIGSLAAFAMAQSFFDRRDALPIIGGWRIFRRSIGQPEQVGGAIPLPCRARQRGQSQASDLSQGRRNGVAINAVGRSFRITGNLPLSRPP